MTRRNKIIFFLSLLTLFVVVTPLIIFYSLGWRFNWKERKPEQPGVFYFKILPKSSEIYLQGKLKKKTDFFFGSALIENLSPKKYLVEIKKEGFQTWKKTLEITKGNATEAKNVLLIPSDLKYQPISEEAAQFWVLPDEKNMIIQETVKKNSDLENKISTVSLTWFLSIFDLYRNLKIPLLGENDLSAKSPSKEQNASQLVSLEPSLDSKKILLKTLEDKKAIFYFLDLSRNPISVSYVNLPDPESIEKIYFDPADALKILFLQFGDIFEKNLGETKNPSIFKKGVLSFSVSQRYIFFLDNSGFLFRVNPFSSQEEKLNSSPLQLEKDAEYAILHINSYIFVKENNVLYKLDEEKNKFEKTAEGVKNVVFSPDGKKLAFSTDKEIWLLFLEKNYDQPQKEKGEKLFLTRFSDDLEQLFWLTNHYLLFNSKNIIKVAEIDERDNVNIVDIGDFKGPKIFWSQINKEFFVLSEKNFYSLKNLVP